jgi:hypothetical protein
MRGLKLSLVCAAVLMTATISTGAIAQAGAGGGGGGRGQGRGFGQGRGGFGGPPSLSNISLTYLTAALGLNDEQKTKIQAAQEKVRTDMRAAFQDAGQGGDRAAMQAKMKEINDQAKTDIEAVLTDAQKKKVDAVLKDAGTYNGAGIPLDVVPELKLTADQKKKLADIAEAATKEQQATMKDIQDARQAGDNQKAQELMQTMRTSRQAVQEKAQAVLNDEQKASIEKYNKEHPRGQRPGGQRAAGAGNA